MELKEQLKKILNGKSSEEITIIEKQILKQKLSLGEEDILKKLVLENISGEKSKIENFLKDTKIYISFMSLSRAESWEITPTMKSLKLFKNVEHCYLLATEESLQEAQKEKEEILAKYPKFKNNNIKIIIVSTEDYEDTYKKLQHEIYNNILKKEYNLNNIIIDNTLGYRMITGVLYRFAVEQGIKLISWQNEHYRDEQSNSIKRIPATDKLNFLEFPQLKNFKTISIINELIDEYKFYEAELLCKVIHNDEKAEVMKKISGIYDRDNILNSGNFLEFIEMLCEEKIDIGNESIKISIKNLLKNLKEILGLNEEQQDIIYYSICCKNLKDMNSKGIIKDDLVKKFLENLNEYIDDLGLEDKIEDLSQVESLEDILYTISENLEIEDEKSILKLTTHILEDLNTLLKELKFFLPKTIFINSDGEIEIKKLNIKISLREKETKKFFPKHSSKKSKLLERLINNQSFKLSFKEFDEVYYESETKDKYFVDFKKYLGELNLIIRNKLEINNIKIEEDFINVETLKYLNFSKNKKEIEISEKFI